MAVTPVKKPLPDESTTATGVLLAVVVLLPSWPCGLLPQHWTPWFTVAELKITQVWVPPEPMVAPFDWSVTATGLVPAAVDSATDTGDGLAVVVVPLPICPWAP